MIDAREGISPLGLFVVIPFVKPPGFAVFPEIIGVLFFPFSFRLASTRCTVDTFVFVFRSLKLPRIVIHCFLLTIDAREGSYPLRCYFFPSIPAIRAAVPLAQWDCFATRLANWVFSSAVMPYLKCFRMALRSFATFSTGTPS